MAWRGAYDRRMGESNHGSLKPRFVVRCEWFALERVVRLGPQIDGLFPRHVIYILYGDLGIHSVLSFSSSSIVVELGAAVICVPSFSF